MNRYFTRVKFPAAYLPDKLEVVRETTQLCGFGNVDVYADFKFKRPMMILLFPCEEKDLESRYEALVRDLQAESSYNKWDVLARSDEAR